MSNLDTTADVIYQQNNSQPIVLSPANQGHFQFMLGAGPAVLTVPNPMSTAFGASFPGRSAQALPLIIRAAGTYKVGGQVHFQLDINQGTGLSPAIATTGLFQTTGGPHNDNWLIEAECLWDAASTNLRGIYYGWIGNTAIAQAALVNPVPAALANLNFNAGLTVLEANPTDSWSLTEFSVSFV